MLTREEILNALQMGMCNMEFRIRSDSITRIIGTLNEGYFAYLDDMPSQTENTISVWDIERNRWRTFNWSDLRYIDGVEYPNGV